MKKTIYIMFVTIMAITLLSGCSYKKNPTEQTLHGNNNFTDEVLSNNINNSYEYNNRVEEDEPATDFDVEDSTENSIENDSTEQDTITNNTDESRDEQEITKDILLKSTTNSLSIRSGPGTSYRILGSINRGDMVPYIAKENSSWYKTIYKGKTAYISKAYTTFVQFDITDTRIENVILEAKKLLGYPYVWGAQRYHWGNGILNTDFVMGEFDCSSLTQYAYYMGAGIELDLTTRTQVYQGRSIEKSDIKRGDLLFFTNSSRYFYTGTKRVGHVAIYLGDNHILHTASDYAVIEEISSWRWNYYITARRFIF